MELGRQNLTAYLWRVRNLFCDEYANSGPLLRQLCQFCVKALVFLPHSKMIVANEITLSDYLLHDCDNCPSHGHNYTLKCVGRFWEGANRDEDGCFHTEL